MITYMEFDFECNTTRQLSNTVYSSDDIIIISKNKEEISAQPITPGTISETALSILNEYNKVYKNKERMDEFIKKKSPTPINIKRDFYHSKMGRSRFTIQ